mmetsp:Transcript_131564/g.262531  ORF Transcript_131564/g.262531 Transcript_131564/m.262531 type:complete len:606 (-) Transcript_131564:8-1825(-)
MAFSGGVILGDLDDFLSPAQDCVLPLLQAADGGTAKVDGADVAKVALSRVPVEQPLVQRPNLIKPKKSSADPKAEIGQVSLSDCLACSGCVTSAETVLLQQQSGEEFLKRASEAQLTIVSISAEARASLALHCDASPLLTLRRVAEVLRRIGVAYVLESSAAEAIALLEGKAEFVRRYREANRAADGRTDGQAAMPLLTSHCPGWTCYAEKVVDPVVLPHLGALKSPQQVQGRLAKSCLLDAHNRRRLHHWWRLQSPLFAAERSCWLPAAGRGDIKAVGLPGLLKPSQVYHVSVQPCFDRKIESARPHSLLPGADDAKEVDTVLTAAELLDIVRGAAGGAVPEVSAGTAPADVLEAVSPVALNGEILTDLLLGDLCAGRTQPLLCAVGQNAGNGGFIEHIFKEAATELFGVQLNSQSLEFRTVLNQDMKEVQLLDSGSTQRVLLKFTAAHGFRNIQNIVRRITKPSTDPNRDCGHFVEIMACPGGCLNGGGQVSVPKAARGQQRRTHLQELEDILIKGDGTAVVPPSEHPLILPLYEYMVTAAQEITQHEILRRGGLVLPDSSASAKLEDLIGCTGVRQWLAADWKSLKVDSEGNAVVGTSALKW